MRKILTFTAFFAIAPLFFMAQTIYLYPLKADFLSIQTGGPELVVIPNNDGLTGEFINREVPEETCGTAGLAGGYFFEDDAGLQFNNPEGFIEQSYSLAFNFQIDEFITPPQWVRLLSFTHIDDVGVYIKLTGAPDSGTLEFWPYGTVGETNFFSPNDFYQLILVRNNDGTIKIYVNGQEFAEYDDSQTMKYLPQEPDDFIVFFRDHPSVLADEASPGFVSALRITNLAWTPSEVQAIWEEFCSSLLSNDDLKAEQPPVIFPNPVKGIIRLENLRQHDFSEYAISDLTGRIWLKGDILENVLTIDASTLSHGLYMLTLISGEKRSTIKMVKR
jgi:hypothetical protein